MLIIFWAELIQHNVERNCYFHNFGGYDSILSLIPLLTLPNYTFTPVLKDGEIISLRALDSKGKVIFNILDSMRILPAPLAKLAKDWKVETQKDHFPHYFFLNSIQYTLNYKGSIPPYNCFEPKRTREADYDDMVQEFSNKVWSFLDLSKSYILGDVKALYQIMIKFFNTLSSKFPINPLSVLSAPSAAFKIWRTVQLPLLNKDLLKVYYLSRSFDAKLRQGYCGGIVDVYRPHLIGEGYYYDVNSLYPTAMCKPMPVDMPTFTTLTPTEFEAGSFFGYVEATVQAPDPPGPTPRPEP